MVGLNFGNLFPSKKETNTLFSFQDIETGTGVVEFYAIREMKDSGYHWIENKINITTEFDNVNYSGLTEANSGATKQILINTEDFKFPRTISGIPTIKLALWKNATGGVTFSNIVLQRVTDAGVENLTTPFNYAISSGDEFTGSVFLKLDEVTNQRILKGQKIRLSMTLTGGNLTKFFHNPGGDSETRVTLINIPFKIDI